MNLLVVTEDFPPTTGGIQSYCRELAERFHAQLPGFGVAAPSHPRAKAFDRTVPYPVFRVPATNRFHMDVACTTAVPTLCVRHRFDAVLHAQWNTAHGGLIARGLRLTRRVFVAAHGRELLIDLMGNRSANRRVRGFVIRRVDHIFPVSRYTAGLLGELGADPARVTVINNGVDAHLLSPTDGTPWRHKWGLGEAPVVLTLARLVRRKGIDTTLRAMTRVIEAMPSVRYVVAGEGYDGKRLRGLVRKLGIGEHVRFIGHVADRELSSMLSAADLFVMPARSKRPDVEGFGIVFLEANACETPSVAAAEGGVTDAIEDGVTGLLVPPGDVEALAEALIGLLRDPERARRLGRQGRQRILASKTWDHVAAQMLEKIRAVLDA